MHTHLINHFQILTAVVAFAGVTPDVAAGLARSASRQRRRRGTLSSNSGSGQNFGFDHARSGGGCACADAVSLGGPAAVPQPARLCKRAGGGQRTLR